MGKVVGAFATSHILMGSPEGDPAAQRVVAGMKELGRRVRACRPDVIYVIGADHMFNISLKLQPPFTVGVADRYLPLGDMDIPRQPIPGARVAAEALCRHLYASGFDPAKAEELLPDHGITVPMMFVQPKPASIPIVPILVNINMDPPPTPARCRALGEAIGRSIADDSRSDARAVVIGTGGLSHWINIDRHGEVDEREDRAIIDLFLRDRLDEISQLSSDEIVRRVGNGGLEIVNWLMAASAASQRRPQLLFYEPMPHWLTGMGGMVFAADSA
jgi:2'-aminobiphenyl-2,3-diol 1,2-dioxygenase large subunit